MKNQVYKLLKCWIASGLYFYYGNIKVSGVENIPHDKPVLFLPNHQAALMDVLLIATNCGRKPYFLSRSDVFKKQYLRGFFNFLRMIPIYRGRDGRNTLKYNQEIFDHCGDLLAKGHALVIFPEANHNVRRQVRPLSKGFVRILLNTLEKHPHLDLYLVPVGLNYVKNTGFPDRVALYFDRPLEVAKMVNGNSLVHTANDLKVTVFQRLKKLTTHIEKGECYEQIIIKLDKSDVDYLNPFETNKRLKKGLVPTIEVSKGQQIGARTFWKVLFVVLNFAVLIPWRLWLKPRVWEPEFTATLRFGFAILVCPVYFALLFLVAYRGSNLWVGCILPLVLFLFNWLYVKKMGA